MKRKFTRYLLLGLSTRGGHPFESAGLGYLLLDEPARGHRPDEEPPPGILRRLSAGGPREDAAASMAGLRAAPLPAAPPPPVMPRARRTPPRPWA